MLEVVQKRQHRMAGPPQVCTLHFSSVPVLERGLVLAHYHSGIEEEKKMLWLGCIAFNPSVSPRAALSPGCSDGAPA